MTTAALGRAPAGRVVRTVLTEPFRARTWREVGYLVVGVPLAVAGFAVLFWWSALSAVLVVTLVGLPLFALSTYGARFAGTVWRGWAATTLGERTPAPAPLPPSVGLLGWLQTALRDPAGWRARAYVLLRFPFGVLTAYATFGLWIGGLSAFTYPLWQARATRDDAGPPWVRFGHHPGGWDVLLVFVIGTAMLLAAPWVTHGLVWCDRQLQRLLLGPTGAGERIATLQRARSLQAEDAAATLRRIERDLHDGAQAQLTTVAMSIGLAREKLDAATVPDDVRGLVDTAHQQAKDALVLLRGIARSIHPPALDVGLDNALATLVARSVVPATLRTDLPVRPSASIETTAYFAAAELLTNVAKHSGAHHADVDLRVRGDRLVLQVDDDGVGGARVATGTGLPGLADRVAAVDGSLDVRSPAGGPTRVVVELPLHA